MVNNIFAAPGGGFAYVVSTPAAIDTSDYNDFFVTDTILAYWNGNVSNLAALQAASGKDANSITVNPQFISNTDLHARAAEIDSAGTPLAEVVDDIDDEVRDATFPDIGADEFIFGFNYAPEITSQPDTLAKVDSLYEYQVTATDRNGDTLVFRLNSAPGFLSIDTTTGLISGTPATGDVGDHTITVEVDDQNGGTDTQTYTLHVIPTVGIDPSFNQIPKEFVIYQNYPNPFNPVTHIRYGVPRAAHVKIEVYNSLGQKLTELVNEYKPAGYHLANFEASSFASGIYFYRIVAGDYHVVKKMMLLK